MPNWVRNRVKIEGNFDLIKERLCGEEHFNGEEVEYNEFDFNKIIPKPKTMGITSGGNDKVAMQYAISKKSPKERLELKKLLENKKTSFYGNYYEKIYGHKITKEEMEKEKDKFENQTLKGKDIDFENIDYKSLRIESFEDLGNTYLNNIIQYGCDSWYDWCCKYWGTKWNSSGALIVDNNTYEFDTAWSTPYEVLVELSKQFPNSKISVDYADEDIGNNCGGYILKNGKLIAEYYGDDDFALDLWGYDEEMKKEFYEECRNND